MSGSTASRTLSPGRTASLLLPPLIVMGVIFFLSAQANLGTHTPYDFVLRKLAHVTEYAVLAFAWWRALRGLALSWTKGHVVLVAIGIALLYASSDEFHQTFVRGRHGTPVDVLIDSVGIAIGALVATRIYARRRSLGPSRPSAA